MLLQVSNKLRFSSKTLILFIRFLTLPLDTKITGPNLLSNKLPESRYLLIVLRLIPKYSPAFKLEGNSY